MNAPVDRSLLQTTLRKMGNSTGMILPKAILDQLGLASGAKIALRVEDGRVIAEPVKRKVREGWEEDAKRIGAMELTEEERDWLEFDDPIEGDDDIPPEWADRQYGPVTIAGPKRGEIWLTRLDPTEGRELRKTRPCLIVTPDVMNARLGTVGVMPMTTGNHPARFRTSTQYKGIPGLLLGDHLRSVSKSRLLKRLGTIDDDTLSRALATLRDMFEE